MDIIAFGNRVKAAREPLGITQEYLAARVCMSPSHMSIVERGVKVPQMDTVVKLVNELDVSADYLLQDSFIQSRNNQLLTSIMELPKRSEIVYLTKHITARIHVTCLFMLSTSVVGFKSFHCSPINSPIRRPLENSSKNSS